jgi:hypothetical protein
VVGLGGRVLELPSRSPGFKAGLARHRGRGLGKRGPMRGGPCALAGEKYFTRTSLSPVTCNDARVSECDCWSTRIANREPRPTRLFMHTPSWARRLSRLRQGGKLLTVLELYHAAGLHWRHLAAATIGSLSYDAVRNWLSVSKNT